MYALTGTPLSSIISPVPTSEKTPVLSEVNTNSSYQSSHNDPISKKNSEDMSSVRPSRMTEYMDSNLESLLKEQIFLLKFILLFLGFMLLSNILAKKN